MLVRSFGSGSSGNCFLLSSGESHLMVDCGVARYGFDRHLAALDLTVRHVSAVLISHEHGDHVRSLPRLQGRGVLVHGTRGTLDAVGCGKEGVVIPSGRQMEVAGFHVEAIPISHDAAEPCGYSIVRNGIQVVILTDVGRPEPHFLPHLSQASLIIIEANHDRRMLREGPYPSHLKKRIVSGSGHLSNHECGELLAAAVGLAPRRQTVWLAHMSRTNNRPDIAVSTIQEMLAGHRPQPVIAALKPAGGEVWPTPGAEVSSEQLGFRW